MISGLGRAVLTLGACLMAAAPAAAEPRWSPPEVVYSGGAGAANLAAGPGGAALIAGVAIFPSPAGSNELDNRIVAVERNPGKAAWETPRILTGREYAHSLTMASDGAGHAVFTWLAQLPGTRGRTALRAASWSSGKGVGPIETITETSEPIISPYQVLTNQRGDDAVAWMGDGDIGVAVRPPGGSFGAPERLTSSTPAGARDLELALSPLGDVAVAFTGDGPAPESPDTQVERNLVRFRPAGGAFGGSEYFSSDRFVSRPQLAFDHGDLIALYGRSLYGAASPNPDEDGLQATTRPAGGSFGPPVSVPGSTSEVFRPELVQSESGELLAFWGENRYSWRYASRPSGSTFASSKLLAMVDVRDNAPRGYLDADGFGVIAWDQSQNAGKFRGTGPTRLIATVRQPGGLFDRPQAISPFGRPANALPAVDGTGRAYVAVNGNCVMVVTYAEPSRSSTTSPPCLRPASDGAEATDPPLVELSSFEANVSGTSGRLTVRAACDEPCTLTAGGQVSVARRRAGVTPEPAALLGRKRTRITFRLSKSAVKLVRTRGARAVQARLRVTAQNGVSARRMLVETRTVKVR